MAEWIHRDMHGVSRGLVMWFRDKKRGQHNNPFIQEFGNFCIYNQSLNER